MNAEQIRDLQVHFQGLCGHVKLQQSPELTVEILKLWQFPADVIADDANLAVLLEFCWLWHGGCVDPSLLSASCDRRYGSKELRRHIPPTPAPAPLAEPEPAQPKLEGRDSLGDGATSTEKPISTIVSPATTESTALRDGVAYAWNKKNYKNQCEALRQQAWRETPLVNGLPDHAKINQRYAELKDALDKTINTPKKNASLMKVRDAAFAEARSAGVTTYNELMRRIDAAVEAAKGK
jgi:hypothetical protein